MKYARLMAVALVLVVAATSQSFAQDVGTPDTCRYQPESVMWDIATPSDTVFSVELWGWSDETSLTGASLGFQVSTSTGGGTGADDSLIVVDTFIFSSDVAAIPVKIYTRSLLDSSIDPGAEDWGYNGYSVGLIQFVGTIFPPSVPTKIGDLYIKVVDPTQLPCDFEIYVDSSFFPPAGEFKYSPSGGVGFPPQFTMATISVENDLCAPSPTIGVSPDSMFFSAVYSGANPSSQMLSIFNTGAGTLNWSVSDDAPWLSLNPTSGSGDGQTEVSIDTTGVPVGTFGALITVSDPAATNSPVEVGVLLEVLPPPPVIGLDPTLFSFTAVQGGANPPSQTMSVSNLGHEWSTLEWSAENLTSWLSLDPTSGVDDSAVTLTVDISGLSAGGYVDTITVSDSEATNNPQKALVELTITEPPPEISLDPVFLSFSAVEGGSDPPDQYINITNTGGQTLNWTATPLLGTWLSVNPTSGSGDGQIAAQVDITGLSVGTYLDSIDVSDPAATNSPQLAIVELVVQGVPTGIKAEFQPDPAYVYFKFAVNPIIATVYVGNFNPPYTANDVAGWTVIVNGGIPTVSTNVLPSYPGFVGEVLEANIEIADFLEGYGLLFDTTSHEYVVEGEFIDSIPFVATDSVDLIGKKSTNPKEYITPDDIVVVAGDMNSSGWVDIDDIVAILDYAFTGGYDPAMALRGDCDCSGNVDIDDIVYLVGYIFANGPEPCMMTQL